MISWPCLADCTEDDPLEPLRILRIPHPHRGGREREALRAPPRIVAYILGSEERRRRWVVELKSMADRITLMRTLLPRGGDSGLGHYSVRRLCAL